MSGSPVIARTWGMYKALDGNNMLAPGAHSKFLGVYSGRLPTQDPLEAQIGLVWPAVYIDEIVTGGVQENG